MGSGADAATVRLDGHADFTGDFSFRPRFKIAWDIDASFRGPELDFFEVSAGGDLRSRSQIDFDINATVVSGRRDALAVSTDQPLFRASTFIPKLLKQSRPYRGPQIGPVPTTFRVYLYLDCRYAVAGTMQGSVSTDVNIANARVGARYDDDNWQPIAEFPINASGTANVRRGGAATVECGLRPVVAWRIADRGGPEIFARGSVELSTNYNEVCPVAPTFTAPADAVVTSAIGTRFTIGLGGTVDLWVTDVGIGPFELYGQDFPGLYERTTTFAGAGLKNCPGTCDNGALDGDETDVDCSGACRACAVGRDCDDGDDCVSGFCATDGICVGSACEDGRQSVGEAGVDCGRACPGQPCASGVACTQNADCGSGHCAASNVCVDSACLNGRQDVGESDLDCGGPCSLKCGLAQRCVVGSDCGSAVCAVNNVCVADRCADGRRNFDETDVDCGGLTCAARCEGGCRADSDCAQDNGLRVCGVNGLCTSTCTDGRKNAGESDVDCGAVCAGQACGLNRGCGADADCASGFCNERNGRCVENSCFDGTLNGDETATDCGGATCRACSVSKACRENRDCLTNVCGANGTCVLDACSDGQQNGDETDLDCGGSCIDNCATGGSCVDGDDCKSGLCVDNICVSDRCQDRVKNGNETGVDCGGSCAANCAVGVGCFVDDDCDSGICNTTFTGTCAADQCGDGILNNDETDIDCGGSCDACDAGFDCVINDDCDSGVCNVVDLVCAVDSCDSGLQDGDETAVDCGGSCAQNCGLNESCLVNDDCQSNACVDGFCAQDQCSNGTQDGDETDVDCGGSCQSKCDAGETCAGPGDCGSGFCQAGTNICVDDHCVDGIQNANESGPDCGGPDCNGCGFSFTCNVNGDCASGICSANGVCVDDRCFDGFANGDETDVDCGGSTCSPRCGRNQGCGSFNDCSGGDQCNGGQCVEALPRSCLELFNRGVRADGVYTIDLDGQDRGFFEGNVFCNMSEGGWTLAWMLNSAIDPAGGAPNAGPQWGGTFSAPGLGAHPSTGVFTNVGSLPIGRGTQVPLSHTVFMWTSYDNGVEVFRSDEISVDSLRIAQSPFRASYDLFGTQDASVTPSRYFMCSGNGPFTDANVGQENTPPGSPPGCKGHNGLNGGYDFSESLTVNQGLTATGSSNSSGAIVRTGVMNTGPGGRFVPYGTAGAIHATWFK